MKVTIEDDGKGKQQSITATLKDEYNWSILHGYGENEEEAKDELRLKSLKLIAEISKAVSL